MNAPVKTAEEAFALLARGCCSPAKAKETRCKLCSENHAAIDFLRLRSARVADVVGRAGCSCKLNDGLEHDPTRERCVVCRISAVLWPK